MKLKSNLDGKYVYVVDGCRTPFLKAKNIGAFTGADLAVATGQTLLNRQTFTIDQLDEVIIGSAISAPNEANIARVVTLRLGCGNKVPAFTVMRNCASGMQAIDTAAMYIASGRSNLILVGGTEAMSHAPMLLNQQLVTWLNSWRYAKQYRHKIMTLMQFKLAFLTPVIALLQGLTDPILGLNMGQTVEELAYKFNITRAQMDEFALESHRRAECAYLEQRMEEVIPIIDHYGKLYSQDDGIKPNLSLEQLSQFKPVFDKNFGLITAANSSQITDGACMLLLASQEAVKKYNLSIIGRIIDSQWAALEPINMGLGPVHAAIPILKRHHLKPNDLDCFEINEAFAAQILSCLAAFNDEEYNRKHFGLSKPLGAPDLIKVNPDGGAIAIGHPIGASGVRIVLHVLQSLKHNNGKRGMATLCVGGGQGGAMYLERRTVPL